MSKVKAKKRILGRGVKNGKRIRKSYKNRVTEWMGEYYWTKPF